MPIGCPRGVSGFVVGVLIIIYILFHLVSDFLSGLIDWIWYNFYLVYPDLFYYIIIIKFL